MQYFQIPHCFRLSLFLNKCVTQYRLFSSSEYKWLPARPTIGTSTSVTLDNLTTTHRVDSVVLPKDFVLTDRPNIVERKDCQGKDAEHLKLELLFEEFIPKLVDTSKTAFAQQLNRMQSEEIYGHLKNREQIPAITPMQTQELLKRVSDSKAGFIMFICPPIHKDLPPIYEVVPKPFDPSPLLQSPESADFPVSITDMDATATQSVNERKRALDGAKQIAKVAMRMLEGSSTKVAITTATQFSYDTEKLTPEEVDFYRARLTKELVIELIGAKYREAAMEPWCFCPRPLITDETREQAIALKAAEDLRMNAMKGVCVNRVGRAAYNIPPTVQILSYEGRNCADTSGKRALAGQANSTVSQKRNKTAQTVLDAALVNAVIVCNVLACTQKAHHACTNRQCVEGAKFCVEHRTHKQHVKMQKKVSVPVTSSSVAPAGVSSSSAPPELYAVQTSSDRAAQPQAVVMVSTEELCQRLHGRYGYKPSEYLYEAADPGDIKAIKDALSTNTDDDDDFCLNLWLEWLEKTKRIIDREDDTAKYQSQKPHNEPPEQAKSRKRQASPTDTSTVAKQRSRKAPVQRLLFTNLPKFKDGTLAASLLEDLINESEKNKPDYDRRVISLLHFSVYKAKLAQLLEDYDITWSMSSKFPGDTQDPCLVDFSKDSNRQMFLKRFVELLVDKYSA